MRVSLEKVKVLLLVLVTIVIWVGVFYGSYRMFSTTDIEPNPNLSCTDKTECSVESPCCLGKVKIYAQGNSAYGELEREEALKFGLEKIDTTINYVFIAVAGILALLGKIVIEPLTHKEKITYLTNGTVWLITNSALLCISSVVVGFIARLYFTSIGDMKSFSIYGELAGGILIQFFLFLLAFIFLMIAVVTIVLKKIKNGD